MKKLTLSILLVFLAFAGNTQTGKDAALSSLGAFGGAALYDTYVVIGSVADSYADDVYEAGFVINILDEQMSMLENLKASATELKNSGFITDPSDFDYINQMTDCMNLLTQQAQAMKDYVNNPTTENSDAFQARRTASWDKVSKMLGIE